MGLRYTIELICATGHYVEVPSNYLEPWKPYQELCELCKERMVYSHDIDTTNGYEESESDFFSCDAPKEELSFTDTWHKDHYGNQYAVKHLTYTPSMRGENGWTKIPNPDNSFS